MNPIQESQPGAPANALLQTIDAPADLRKLSRAQLRPLIEQTRSLTSESNPHWLGVT